MAHRMGICATVFSPTVIGPSALMGGGEESACNLPRHTQPPTRGAAGVGSGWGKVPSGWFL
jgi:hypothetical protein